MNTFLDGMFDTFKILIYMIGIACALFGSLVISVIIGGATHWIVGVFMFILLISIGGGILRYFD